MCRISTYLLFSELHSAHQKNLSTLIGFGCVYTPHVVDKMATIAILQQEREYQLCLSQSLLRVASRKLFKLSMNGGRVDHVQCFYLPIFLQAVYRWQGRALVPSLIPAPLCDDLKKI